MAFVDLVPKTVDKGDCEDRKGPVEIYVCGALIEMGVLEVMIRVYGATSTEIPSIRTLLAGCNGQSR